MSQASATSDGWLSQVDWNRFNDAANAAVWSVFGRSGDVIAQPADYAAFYQPLGSYEPALGNPAANGYVLSSTVGGIRSWVFSVDLPAGGTAGQVLTKDGPIDYDVSWATPAAGGAVDSVFGRTGAVVAQSADYAGFYEPPLGYPAANGYVLQSTAAGIRSWGVSAGLPGGGTAGQVLIKNSATNYDANWATITGGTGGGTVLSFSAGNLPPLFTSTVATATTTPALTFNLSAAAQNTFLGYTGTGTGLPTYQLIPFAALSSKPTTLAGYGIVAASGDYAAFYPAFSGAYSDPAWITSLSWAKITGAPASEPPLGNPAVNGYVLSSTTAGVRSWIAAAAGGGGGSITISDTAPASPTAGALWWESDTGNLYIWYSDADSSQWVQIATGPAGPAGQGVPAGGAAGQRLTKNSATNYDTGWQTVAAPGNVIVILASTTYTPSAGCRACFMEAWGGGGGGGGANCTTAGNNSEGGGGGSGGYSGSYIVSPAASYVVTIGAGGAGVAGGNGAPGGMTSIGSACAAAGGAGSGFNLATVGPIIGNGGGAGADAAAGIGNLYRLYGQQGEGIIVLGGGGFQARGGVGGNCPCGAVGGRGNISNTNTASVGLAGGLPGGGGGGACSQGTGGSAAGGAGAQGMVRITEYF
jgi:hypothetical protein